MDNKETLELVREAIDRLRTGKTSALDLSAIPDEPETADLLESLGKLITDLDEIRRFTADLCQGQIDAQAPGRRNYLAGSLKELHAQLLSLTWSMEQLINGQMVTKLFYAGRMFEAYNKLVDMIAKLSGRVEDDETATTSVNSWRYHQLLSALNTLRIMVFEVDEQGDIVYVNRTARDYVRNLKSLAAQNLPPDSGALLKYLALFSTEDNEFPVFRELYDEKSGSWYKITSDHVTFFDGQGGYLHVVDDISEWKLHESRLQRTATTDALTGLYNRRVGINALGDALFPEGSFKSCAAFVDIDNLKPINDLHGHSEGDWAIKAISDILRTSVRDRDVVSRFGGDEFLIVFINCELENAQQAIERMRQKLRELTAQANKPYPLAFSVGLVEIMPGESSSPQELIEKMDAIMYENKRRDKAKRENNRLPT